VQEQVQERELAQLRVLERAPMPVVVPVPVEPDSFARGVERSDLRFGQNSIPAFCCNRR
jgi:hypothetical protein